MGRRARGQLPQMRLHRRSGTARVRIGRKEFCLGRYGSPEATRNYSQFIQQYLLDGGLVSEGAPVQPPPARLPAPIPAESPAIGDPPAADRLPLGDAEQKPEELTIAQMCAAFFKDACKHYVTPDGGHTSTIGNAKTAIRALKPYYDVAAGRFGPLMLRKLMLAMEDQPGRRKGPDGKPLPKPRVTINRTIKSIRRIFRWAASMELVPPSVPDALEKLELLRKGRTTAPELPKVEVVPDDIVQRTLPYLPEMVADMVRIQRLIGCRPGEICGMRPCDIDRSGPQWLWRPVTHKNDWRGHDRVSAIGPKAQIILERYLDRDPITPCFVPAESENARNAARRRGRKSAMTPSHRARRARASRKPKVIKPYSQASYRRAITRACEQAKIPAWSPNRLRHSAGQEARREMGLDAAQARLGHKDARVTEVYATVGIEKACQVAERLG